MFELLITILLGLLAVFCIAVLTYPFLFRDLPEVLLGLRIYISVFLRQKQDFTIVDDILQIAHSRQFSAKPCILYQSESYSYADFDYLSNQFANFVRRHSGLKCGDTVALFMYNEPAFLWTWLGFAKLGISCAFLNYNIRSKSLQHCLDVSNAKVLVVGKDEELRDAILEIDSVDVKLWMKGTPSTDQTSEGVHWIDSDVSKASFDAIPRYLRRVKRKDVCLYIYTSGTTGLPKPAKISYERLTLIVHVLDSFYITHKDVVYTPLPLYHSSAFLITFSGIVTRGATLALSKKFSATHYWQDCRKFDATVIVYIGETCRYLLAKPQNLDETNHKLRMAIGNGLRPDIWTEFKNRFNIPVIGEFYGATEGNVFFRNMDGRVGAVGRMSPLLKLLRKFDIIEFDYESSLPVRGPDGRCVRVPLGEQGLLITRIDKLAVFDGYAGEKSNTQKKILENVFVQGDRYFNSGDIMVLDSGYYLYFRDCIGDTFRWKGENVATTEVAQVLGEYPAIKEANVYGVEVQGNVDGKAGMAAITIKDGAQMDPSDLFSHVTSYLPMYACPKFIRIMEEIEVTGTYKHTKLQLVKDGFDPASIKQPMLFMNFDKKTYVDLDSVVYKQIINNELKI
ncbi:long-chain fatty acid transport protein 2-like [Saccoglossus kowalevskii]